MCLHRRQPLRTFGLPPRLERITKPSRVRARLLSPKLPLQQMCGHWDVCLGISSVKKYKQRTLTIYRTNVLNATICVPNILVKNNLFLLKVLVNVSHNHFNGNYAFVHKGFEWPKRSSVFDSDATIRAFVKRCIRKILAPIFFTASSSDEISGGSRRGSQEYLQQMKQRQNRLVPLVCAIKCVVDVLWLCLQHEPRKRPNATQLNEMLLFVGAGADLFDGDAMPTVDEAKHGQKPELFPVLSLTRQLLLRRASFLLFCNVDQIDVKHSMVQSSAITNASVSSRAMTIGDAIAHKLLLNPIATVFTQSFPSKHAGAKVFSMKASQLLSSLVTWTERLDCLVGHPQ